MNNPNPDGHIFTVSYDRRVRELVSPVQVVAAFSGPRPPDGSKGVGINGIWDTGATGTCITEAVVNACQLQRVGMTDVHGAHGVARVPTYQINVLLPNGLMVRWIKATQAVLPGNFEMLIGMDIIGLGDFAVTNKDGKTTFSFRFPSMDCIDFLKGSWTENPAT